MEGPKREDALQELAHILRIKTVNSEATSGTHAEIVEEALEQYFHSLVFFFYVLFFCLIFLTCRWEQE